MESNARLSLLPLNKKNIVMVPQYACWHTITGHLTYMLLAKYRSIDVVTCDRLSSPVVALTLL